MPIYCLTLLGTIEAYSSRTDGLYELGYKSLSLPSVTFCDF